jgi:hypothetical protein
MSHVLDVEHRLEELSLVLVHPTSALGAKGSKAQRFLKRLYGVSPTASGVISESQLESQ